MARFLTLTLFVIDRCMWVVLFVGMVRVSAVLGGLVELQSLNSWLSEAQQQKLTFTQGSQECWRFSGDSAENLIDGMAGE